MRDDENLETFASVTHLFLNAVSQSMESERIKMSVVRTKYEGAELQYDGLEEVKVRVDKKCRCDCRVKEEVQSTKHIVLADIGFLGNFYLCPRNT